VRLYADNPKVQSSNQAMAFLEELASWY